jgi:hypothetical protein
MAKLKDTTRYAIRRKETIRPDDVQCWRKNNTSDEEDLFVTQIKGSSKDETRRRKFWVHHRFNKSVELGSIGVVRAIDLNSEVVR